MGRTPKSRCSKDSLHLVCSHCTLLPASHRRPRRFRVPPWRPSALLLSIPPKSFRICSYPRGVTSLTSARATHPQGSPRASGRPLANSRHSGPRHPGAANRRGHSSDRSHHVHNHRGARSRLGPKRPHRKRPHGRSRRGARSLPVRRDLTLQGASHSQVAGTMGQPPLVRWLPPRGGSLGRRPKRARRTVRRCLRRLVLLRSRSRYARCAEFAHELHTWCVRTLGTSTVLPHARPRRSRQIRL